MSTRPRPCLLPSRYPSFTVERVNSRIYVTRSQSIRLDDTKAEHSYLPTGASLQLKWGSSAATLVDHPNTDEYKGITGNEGKLAPTPSHLFKLILPLEQLSISPLGGKLVHPHDVRGMAPKSLLPTVILLHPSQPLSHAGRLITASLRGRTALVPTVSFRGISSAGQHFQWSDSINFGDFVREVTSAPEFIITVTYEASAGITQIDQKETEKSIAIRVPTFPERTHYLRRLLAIVEDQLESMDGIMHECDRHAQRTGRYAVACALFVLVSYWTVIFHLGCWEHEWDTLEPITYLLSVAAIICACLWYLYHGEMSYKAALSHTISARREALYRARGLDIEQWFDLKTQATNLRKEIGLIANEYNEHSQGQLREEKGIEGQSRKMYPWFRV